MFFLSFILKFINKTVIKKKFIFTTQDSEILVFKV